MNFKNCEKKNVRKKSKLFNSNIVNRRAKVIINENIENNCAKYKQSFVPVKVFCYQISFNRRNAFKGN